MVLDTLSGRSPLYRLEEFFEHEDIELLLGRDMAAHKLNDTNVGRALDAIFNAGPSKILTEIGVRAAETFALNAKVISYDTTSTSVWGDYRRCEDERENEAPKITYGHSKDKRPDLKQFMTELLCVERGIPIFGRTLDGNSSDKTSNNKMLSRISGIMARHGLGPGAFIYVADSAMITEGNLKELGSNSFVSRLPSTYSVTREKIADAVDENNWTRIGVTAETPGSVNRPPASYKAKECEVRLYGKTYRAVVVHSDSYDKRQLKKLEKTFAASEKKIREAVKKEICIYNCEADALAAQKKVCSIFTDFHELKASVVPVTVNRRGRPPKKGPAPTLTKYNLKWQVIRKEEAIEREKQIAGCFVLISNVPRQGDNALNSGEILKAYKGQYGVESGFAFLKDPIVVNDTFLKKTTRIDALGMVLVIALIIWRLMERSLRAYAGNTGKELPGWENRKTFKPTAFMVSVSMRGVSVLKLSDGRRIILKKPKTKQMAYLEALGLNEDVYINPRFTLKPIIPL